MKKLRLKAFHWRRKVSSCGELLAEISMFWADECRETALIATPCVSSSLDDAINCFRLSTLKIILTSQHRLYRSSADNDFYHFISVGFYGERWYLNSPTARWSRSSNTCSQLDTYDGDANLLSFYATLGRKWRYHAIVSRRCRFAHRRQDNRRRAIYLREICAVKRE